MRFVQETKPYRLDVSCSVPASWLGNPSCRGGGGCSRLDAGCVGFGGSTSGRRLPLQLVEGRQSPAFQRRTRAGLREGHPRLIAMRGKGDGGGGGGVKGCSDRAGRSRKSDELPGRAGQAGTCRRVRGGQRRRGWGGGWRGNRKTVAASCFRSRRQGRWVEARLDPSTAFQGESTIDRWSVSRRFAVGRRRCRRTRLILRGQSGLTGSEQKQGVRNWDPPGWRVMSHQDWSFDDVEYIPEACGEDGMWDRGSHRAMRGG